MDKNNNLLILHGHFYQPPREDPWTDEIETQESAAPFHDWNERINRECYAANAASRVIDSFGRIEAIVNNYEYFSFNFGPTLVDWLSRHDPRTLERIISADRKSRERLDGHGNAIAQVYNHIIMPLAGDADKITQIVWGLRHFEKYFERPSEGIWLAETAINDRTVEFLIEQGIKYVILAPTQAQEVLYEGSDEWEDVSHNSIDPGRAYILEASNGSLAAFFYDGGIASRLSFEHMLTNVDLLRNELLAHFDPDKELNMVNVATDGENYGHHEPYGDMCIARLIYENEERGEFTFSNYGHFLEHHPPRDRVRLKPGNNGLGTAWSCAHGVGRWLEDCGCQTGGDPSWHQKWRHPLRQAFDLLRDRVHELAHNELNKYFKNVWQARDEYIEVISRVDLKERVDSLYHWMDAHASRDIDEQDRGMLMRIMESLHQAMLMYTSCGWFFADISGIETVQDMRYAARIFDLVEDLLPPDTREKFLSILEKAPSNIAEFSNGKWIFENFVWEHKFDSQRVINQFVIEQILMKGTIKTRSKWDIYYYHIEVNRFNLIDKGDWQIYQAQLIVTDHFIQETRTYIVYSIRHDYEFHTFIKSYIDSSLVTYLDKLSSQNNPRFIVKELSDWFRQQYSVLDLKYETRKNILAHLFSSTLSQLHDRHSTLELKEFMTILRLFRDWQINMPEKDMLSIQNLLSDHIIKEMDSMLTRGIEKYDFNPLIQVILSARSCELPINTEAISPLLHEQVLQRMEKAILENDSVEMQRLDKLVDFSNLSGIDFEKSEIQDLLYATLMELTSKNRMPYLKKGQDEERILSLLHLASKYNIASYKFQNNRKEKLDY